MDHRPGGDPADESLTSLLWPQDWPELLIFGFIVVTAAALIGGALNRLFFG